MSGISKRVSGSWVSGDYGIMGISTDTITTLPAVVYPNATTATVGLKGQAVQSSTPSPTSPVMPQGCGNKTANLCDESTLQNGYFDTTTYQYYPNDNYRCFSLLLQAGTYTIFAKSDTLTIRLLRVSSASLGANAVNLDNRAYTFTLSATETIYVSMRNSTTTNDFTGLTIMINSGSQPLPYEPYGYKIPISSASTTTPVYLGEVESTRQIKKYEFTGEESWASFEQSGVSLYRCVNNLPSKISGSPIDTMLCNVLRIVRSRGECTTTSNSMAVYNVQNDSRPVVNVNPMTLSEWTTYIQQQYAAGTPVCVWYVLATPETAVVNEPIRKIGNYADEVSGITIPTIAGANSFDVLTTLKPSEVTVNYKGWHTGAVHECDSGQWD